MARLGSIILLVTIAAVSAVPLEDPVLIKWNSGLRYEYREDAEGKPHLVDQWLKTSDVETAARFNPDVDNVYHLFTRQNPSVSQPFLLGSNSLLLSSNFDAARRTIIIIHGWTGSATSSVNTVLVPDMKSVPSSTVQIGTDHHGTYFNICEETTFLQSEDLNVIVVDWSIGASVIAGTAGPLNAVASGQSVARVIDWIRSVTGTPISNFHLVGHSLGAHQAAVAGRNVNGNIPYITALDPGANMEDSGHIFSPNAAVYTEAIHTNADIMGHGNPLAHVDFYPNGGDYNPGCGINFLCNHNRSFFFFGETLTTTTGFTGRRCATYTSARLGICLGLGTLRMGGLRPKTGSNGIFHLETNAEPPFNKG